MTFLGELGSAASDGRSARATIQRSELPLVEVFRLHRRHQHGRDHRGRSRAGGMPVNELLKFYKDLALKVFKKRKLFER
jgi:hypothetical protein